MVDLTKEVVSLQRGVPPKGSTKVFHKVFHKVFYKVFYKVLYKVLYKGYKGFIRV